VPDEFDEVWTNVSSNFQKITFVYALISFCKVVLEILSMKFKGNKGTIKNILYLRKVFPLISFVYAFMFIKMLIDFKSEVCFGDYFEKFFLYRNYKDLYVSS
jgi:hypothetical protein